MIKIIVFTFKGQLWGELIAFSFPNSAIPKEQVPVFIWNLLTG